MLRLAAGDWTATLLPEAGAAFAALAWRGQPVLRPLSPGADPNRSFEGAFVMAPWANRLDGGRLAVGDTVHRLPVNRPEDGTAIHGFSREHPWQFARADAGAAVLSVALDRPPFRCELRMAVRLSRDAFVLALRLRNLGDTALPMGFGWHPWFSCPPGTHLRFHASERFRHDARVLPIAAEPCAGVDGTEASYAGLDTHFAGWDGEAALRRPDLALRMTVTGAWARNLQVFAPRGDGVLCLEPVSHVPDAPNRPDLAVHGPMAPLPPGGAMAARLVLRAAMP